MKRLNPKSKELFEAVLKLETIEECEEFFTDLCTPAELQALSDRWIVAQLIDKGISYRVIYEKTGVSTATVTRVARSYEYGTGYRALLSKVKSKKREPKV